MITAVDQNPVHSIELMQSSARTSVNQLHSPASTCTIYDNNHTFPPLTEKKSLNSSQVSLFVIIVDLVNRLIVCYDTESSIDILEW